MIVRPDAIETLRAARTDGNKLFLIGKLDPKAYRYVATVLESAGGKWNRKEQATVFEGDARDAIDPILLTGTVVRPQEFGQFDTPPELAARVVATARIEPGMQVLEPSVGIGNLAREIAAAGGVVHAFEIDDKRRARYDALGLSPFPCAGGDFLAFAAPEPGEEPFDLAVMNPPFARQADIDHVTHAARFVKPGGRVVAIMAAGVMFRQDRKASTFRDRVLGSGSGKIELLPEGSFRAAGTDVRTVLVSFDVEGGDR